MVTESAHPEHNPYRKEILKTLEICTRYTTAGLYSVNFLNDNIIIIFFLNTEILDTSIEGMFGRYPG